jgi:hypothetical protein
MNLCYNIFISDNKLNKKTIIYICSEIIIIIYSKIIQIEVGVYYKTERGKKVVNKNAAAASSAARREHAHDELEQNLRQECAQ